MSRPTPFAEPDPQALLGTALRLARIGVPVFPCVADGKRPLTAHGFLDATTDEQRLRSWWQRHPQANLAVPTGVGTFDVLDVDVRPSGSGYPAYQQLLREGLLDGNSHVIVTPSGGLHVYFDGSAQASSRLPGRHLDFKAQGGYVLVPPSVVGGRPYELLQRSAGPHRGLNWRAVREVLQPTVALPGRSAVARQMPRGIEPLAAWVARLPEGQRNTGTFWAACRAVEQGISDLRPIVEAAVQAGLPRREATRTVASALNQRRARGTPPTPRQRGPSQPPPRIPRQFRRR